MATNSNRNSGRRRGRRSSGNARQLQDNIDRTQFNPPITVTFPKNVIGFPDRLVTILKYVQVNSHSGSASPSSQVWTVNSAFDPDNSGTGHQPSFFDVISTVYFRYFVRHFKVEVEICNQLSTTAIEAVCAYSDVNIGANSVDQISEAKYAKWCTVGLNSSGTSVRRINMPWMSTMKLMGTPGLEADDNMYAAVSASPADLAFCMTRLASVDGTTTMTAIVKTSIFMEIVFKDLLTQKDS